MKKAFAMIRIALVWLVVALAVFMMIFTVISTATINRNDRDLFGYKGYIVNSDSMAATDFCAGDLIFVKEVDPLTIRPGDIIAFISQNPDSFGEVVTHKVRKLTKDPGGEPGFITYGTTTNTDDITVVTFPYVLGRYESRAPGLGAFFQFLKMPLGYILCVLLPFMILIIHQGVRCIRLFCSYRREQLEQLEAEKLQIAQERMENAKMVETLLALKAQLEQQGVSAE